MVKKRKSKRVPAKQRYKIERKVREHRRKVKKATKELSKKGMQKRLKKDPGIPNLYPFKEQLLRQMEEQKERIKEDKKRKMLQRKEEANKLTDLTSLQQDAERRAQEFERKVSLVADDESTDYRKDIKEQSRKQYYKEFKKVIDAADVIIEVLDARDPLGCRCLDVEHSVLSSGSKKKLVLLLNKVDLIPRQNIEKWLKYLRNELPVVAFKASTQSQRDHIARSQVAITAASRSSLGASICFGANTLMKLLANYCRNAGLKTTIVVGIVGLPNVGKSSVINSLKRSKACTVGSEPGVTKNMQEVHLDKHIKLLDSPGIIMNKRRDNMNIVLRNCVKLDNVQDLIPAVEAILKRCNPKQIMIKYCVPEYNDVNEFLSFHAHRIGRLKKGGIPNVEAAARSVLNDWNSGKITYYTHPPEEHKMPSHISAEIVSEWSQEFDIDALLKDEKESLQDLGKDNDIEMSDAVVLNPVDFNYEDDMKMESDLDEEESDEEDVELMSMSDSSSANDELTVEVIQKKSSTNTASKARTDIVDAIPKADIPIEKLRKKELKKRRKENRRLEARLATSNNECKAVVMNDADESYDFTADYY